MHHRAYRQKLWQSVGMSKLRAQYVCSRRNKAQAAKTSHSYKKPATTSPRSALSLHLGPPSGITGLFIGLVNVVGFLVFFRLFYVWFSVVGKADYSLLLVSTVSVTFR